MKHLIFSCFVLGAITLSAQPAPPPSHNPAPIPGLAYLAVGGAALAYRHYKNHRDPDN